VVHRLTYGPQCHNVTLCHGTRVIVISFTTSKRTAFTVPISTELLSSKGQRVEVIFHTGFHPNRPVHTTSKVRWQCFYTLKCSVTRPSRFTHNARLLTKLCKENTYT